MRRPASNRRKKSISGEGIVHANLHLKRNRAVKITRRRWGWGTGGEVGGGGGGGGEGMSITGKYYVESVLAELNSFHDRVLPSPGDRGFDFKPQAQPLTCIQS